MKETIVESWCGLSQYSKGIGRGAAILIIGLFTLGSVGFVQAQTQAHEVEFMPLTVTTPEEVGVSEARLEHLTGEIERNIEQEELAGAVVLVARKGEVVYLNPAGMQDREAGIPMQENTIFRIASMTKPITSVAVMMLYEEGHFRMDDPVSKFIPAFENARVYADTAGAEHPDTVPANRPVTISDLLSHTSGLAYHENPKVGRYYIENGISHGLNVDPHTLTEDIPKLAKQPLLHHPGEQWTYGMSVDVLGYLVEVVSGMTLDRFFTTRIFEPLGMHDTAFKVAPGKRDRLAAAYTIGDDGSMQRIADTKREGINPEGFDAIYPLSEDHRFLAGGSGLTSTVPDYFRFTSMLLNGGELDGVRLLSPQTVKLMTTDHVGDILDDMGFGLGFGVTRSLMERGELGGVGTYSWGSFWYGTFFIDPELDLIGISVAQKSPAGGATLNNKFEILVRQALVD